MTASASATGTYFDGTQLKNSWVVDNTDVSHNLNQPWGVANKPLLSAIPADTLVPTFTLQMALYKEDRFNGLIKAFQSNEPTTGLSVEPYLTYAKLVDGVFGALFGTEKTNYPFTLDAGLADDNVKSPKGMYEHFIIAISLNSNKDTWLEQLEGTKLSYDPVSFLLLPSAILVTVGKVWLRRAKPSAL